MRSMSDAERHAQLDRVRNAISITERQATQQELAEAAAVLASAPGTRQPELELKAK